MSPERKAEQILDMFDIEHAGLELMIAESIREASTEELDRCKSVLNRRLMLARRAYGMDSRQTYLTNVINTLEDVLAALDGREVEL